MATDIAALFSIPRIDDAERSLVLKRMQQRLRELAQPRLPAIVDAVAAAIELDRELWRVRSKYDIGKAAPQAQFTALAHQLNAQLDAKLSGLDALLRANLLIHAKDSPVCQASIRLRQELFPGGVSKLTRAPMTTQHSSVQLLLRLMREKFADLVTTAAIPTSLLDGLQDVSTKLQSELTHVPAPLPTYAELLAAQQQCHRALLLVVAHIVTTFGLTPSEDDATLRDALLTDLHQAVEQHRAVFRRAARKSRAKREAKASDPE